MKLAADPQRSPGKATAMHPLEPGNVQSGWSAPTAARPDVSLRERSGAVRIAVRSKILTALLSSWVMSPLAVLFAQLAGFANEPQVLLVLLTVGAVAPIQVLLNEALVPAAVVKKRRLGAAFGVPVALLQAATIASVFSYSATPDVGFIDASIAVTSGVISSSFSTAAAATQLEAILAGKLRHRVIIVIAAVPGLVTLIVFASAGVLRWIDPSSGLRVVYAAIAAPSVAQYLLLEAAVDHRVARRTNRLPIHAGAWILGAALVFLAASSSATALKAAIGSCHERVAALLVVALNSTFSLSFTLGKIMYLEGGRRAVVSPRNGIALLVTATFVSLAVMRSARGQVAILLLGLLLVQAAMTIAISAMRAHLHGRV